MKTYKTFFLSHTKVFGHKGSVDPTGKEFDMTYNLNWLLSKKLT